MALGQQLGHRNIVSTDVGGTTFLAGLIVDGEPVRDTTTVINHHPINVPTLRVNAIGSGGGAIAWLDNGGNLRVGPRSAQAVPGPACYGNGGTEPTNTDANLVLGILPERGLLGGRKPLSLELARQAIENQIAKPLGLTVEEAAAAIYAVQNAQTGDLLRKTVVEAGHDPREFVLYAFGGAGPAHCAQLRRRSRGARGGRAARPGGLGVLGLRAGLLGHRAGAPSCPTRPWSRSTRRGSSRTSPSWRSWSARAWPARACGSKRWSCTARSTCATPCSWPRSPPRWPRARWTPAAIEAAAGAFEQRYAELFGDGTGFREAGIQAITFRVRGTGVLPFSPALPEIGTAAPPTPPTRRRAAARSAWTPPTASWTPRSTTTSGCGPGTCSPARPSSRSRPPPSSSPAGPPATVDPLGNLVMRPAPRAAAHCHCRYQFR